MSRLLRSIIATVTMLAGATWAVASASAASQGRDFEAALAAEWQTKYTESKATGRATFHLDLETLTLSWTVTFKDLSAQATSVTLHGPAQPGTNGETIAKLGVVNARSPVVGSTVLSGAQVKYLLYGWTYINVTTEQFPLGEIRGQLHAKPSAVSPE